MVSLAGWIVAACGSDNGSSQPPPPVVTAPGDSEQATYALQIRQDQESLDKGVLIHTKLDSLGPGESADFQVTVTDIGRSPSLLLPSPEVPGPSAGPGYVASSENVPTGAYLGLAVACSNMECTDLSSARQPVLGVGQTAGWSFEVKAGSPGTARIRIVVTAYRTDTSDVLSEAAPIDVTVPVSRSVTYVVSHALHWLFATAMGLGLFSSGAVLTAAGAGVRLLRKRRRSDVERVIHTIPRAGKRERLLFQLAHVGHVPVEKLLSLSLGNVTVGRSSIMLDFGGKAAPVYIDDRRTARMLREYLRSLNISQGPLFPMSQSTARQLWEAYCALARVYVPLASLAAEDHIAAPPP
ncbi:hypothetical protein ABH935_001515 [Catenulispora sp. GAS73]|uniref:hypothetical protein n=1 Tax=Catenulispora sp. GAS73 TaxID=3156269 RepID=UPI0035195E7E